MIKSLKLRFYFSMILLLSFFFGQAQTDSLSYSTETTQDSAVDYLTPMEYASMFHEETKWLLKGMLLLQTGYSDRSDLNVSLEKKIATGFSLNAVLFSHTSFDLGIQSASVKSYGTEYSLETRWYYKQRKKMRMGLANANLSGVYLALGAGYRKAQTSNSLAADNKNLEFIPVFVKWGFQSRFLKHGFVDVGLKLGRSNSLDGNKWSSFYFGTYVDAGLAYTRDRQTLDFDKLCPVLHCHSADRFALKTNLVGIFDLTYIQNSIIGSISPNISAEFKLGSSPFSINTKLSCSFLFSNAVDFFLTQFRVSPQVVVDGRYYYNLKRRMLMGKSGNGLSANYFSLGMIYRGLFINNTYDGNSYNHNGNFVGMIAGTGIQRLISEHLYFDANFSFGYGKNFYHDHYTQQNSSAYKTIYNLELGVGYRF